MRKNIYIKILGLNKIYNVAVHDYFIWSHLGCPNIHHQFSKEQLKSKAILFLTRNTLWWDVKRGDVQKEGCKFESYVWHVDKKFVSFNCVLYRVVTLFLL